MSKRSASSVNASSFLNLKADLAKKRSEEKGATSFEGDGKAKRLPDSLRPSLEILAKSVKGSNGDKTSKKDRGKVQGRGGSTSSWASTPSAQLDAARIAMERKAQMYDKLRRGKAGGLNEESIVGGLIDWDRKQGERRRRGAGEDVAEDDLNENVSGSDSEEERRWREERDPCDDEDEDGTSSRKKRRKDESLGKDDPMMTYKDEFGRSRTVPKSEVPREILRAMELEAALPDESNVQYGPATSFPVYRPPSPVLEAARVEASRDPTKHFDADFENRDRGAGFYRFSSDEQTRKSEMERIKEETAETERKRMENRLAKGDRATSNREEEKVDLCKASEASFQADKKSLSVGERNRRDRKTLVDRKRLEIYGEEEVKRLENQRVEAFLNYSLRS